MQVFIVGSPFETAQALDPKRLNRQIQETKVILAALNGAKAWSNHPCVLQYRADASGSVFGANISCNKIIAWIKDNIDDYLDYDVSMGEVKVDEKFYEDMKMAIKVK